MRYPPYPSYKSSGVDWLGEVPEHWQVANLRRFAQMKTGHTPSRQHPEYWEECSIPWFTLADVWQLRDGRQTYLGETTEMISELGLANSAAELLPAGTVILSRTASVGFSGIMPCPMATSQDFWNWVCGAQLLPEYLLLLFRAMRPEFQRLIMGSTHQTIYKSDAAALVICAPPFAEQRTIVDAVAIRTRKIDTLVSSKTALIEKLHEQRTALISQLVTRGLPPHTARAAGLQLETRLRPSGIDWLGDVPEHWKVEQLKWAVMFQRGHDLPEGDRQDGEVPVVSSAGVFFKHNRAVAPAPGIVTGRYGTIGQFQLIEEDYWPLNTTLYSVTFRGNNPRFLRYMLEHLSPLFLMHAVKSAVPGVDRNDLHPTLTAVPPVAEQGLIADYLDAETARIRGLISRIQDAIACLRDYRSALITAAVTGKIDMRGTGVSAMGTTDGMNEVDPEPAAATLAAV